jgi:hypothetical protein
LPGQSAWKACGATPVSGHIGILCVAPCHRLFGHDVQFRDLRPPLGRLRGSTIGIMGYDQAGASEGTSGEHYIVYLQHRNKGHFTTCYNTISSKPACCTPQAVDGS